LETVFFKRAPSAGKQNVIGCDVLGSDVMGDLLGLADGFVVGVIVVGLAYVPSLSLDGECSLLWFHCEAV
jgi:hypothetical protein